MNSLQKSFSLLALLFCLSVGCSTFSAQQQWTRRAAAVAPGTPYAQVLQRLPPSSLMLDRRVAGSGGPVTYMVDKDIIVRMVFDSFDTLARPVFVEQLPTKRVSARSDARPSNRDGATERASTPFNR